MVELPRGSHQFLLCHAKLSIEIILNIIHLLYFFCLFFAEPVVMNFEETLCILFRQVETGWFTVWCFGIHGMRGLLPTIPHWDVLYWQCFESQIVYAQSMSRNIWEPYPLNHTPLFVEMLAAGRLPLNCCKVVATLLLNCCYSLQLNFMLCD